MLTITVTGKEYYDHAKGEFVYPESVELQFEHSLVSLSKWESHHEKPFLGKEDKTPEEVLDYLICMIVTPDFPPGVINQLSDQNLKDINAYIEAKMTATWFTERKQQKASTETITAELIYYWMTVYNIPMECQYWHLNRLFTTIKVANLKQAKPEKMSKSEAIQKQRELNAARRAQSGSKG